MLYIRRLIVGLTTGAICACSDGSGPPRAEAGLRIISGADATDTISTQLAQALLVELRDERGDPIVDHTLRFSTVLVDPNQPFGGYGALVSRVDQNQFTNFASAQTDDAGRARVLVKLGIRAGPALVIVTNPDDGTADTATFTVQPGRAVRVVAAPDTSIYVGRTMTLRSSVVDRIGNPRNDPVTHTVTGAAVTVSGSTVTAVALGTATIVTTAGEMSATVTVSVPPEGTLAAFTPRGLATFKTDGSGFQVLAPGAAFRGRTLSWSPTGTEVAFDEEFGSGQIQIATVAGSVRSITPAGSGTLYPRFSRDGQWVYYTRLSRLQRIHPDGTGEEPVPIVNPGIDAAPAFSADGARAVIVRLFANQLLMLDLATGATTDLALVGQTPAWSSAANLIAFVGSGDGNTIRVMNADGTGVRTVTQVNAPYALGIDWTSDGQWIVARSTRRNRVELINATSGEIIPLPYTGGYTGGVSWKP
jgi:hypothetical protein